MVKSDPNWQNGNYYDKEPPVAGVTNFGKVILMNGSYGDFFDETFDRKYDPKKSPYISMDNLFAVEQFIHDKASGVGKRMDGNSILYLAKACINFDLGHEFGSMEKALKRIKAKVFLVSTQNDILFPPFQVKHWVEPLNKAGCQVTYHNLKSTNGHFTASSDILQIKDKLVKFLNE